MTNNIKKAFTLAEVLITLAIIGVVAAMTLPTLILKHQKQQWVTGLQNAYSTISNGFNMIKTQEGTNSLYDTEFFSKIDCVEGNEDCSSILKQYFQIVDFRELTFEVPNFQGNKNGYILNNGISIAFPAPGFIFVDVNGKGKPNKFGRDQFVLQYFDNGKVMSNAVVYPVIIDEIFEMVDDLYKDFKENRECAYADSSICGLGPAFDYDVKFALYQQQRLANEGCDLNNLWTCSLNNVAKMCPTWIDRWGEGEYDYSEDDGGMYCAARIMADGWKMNY